MLLVAKERIIPDPSTQVRARVYYRHYRQQQVLVAKLQALPRILEGSPPGQTGIHDQGPTFSVGGVASSTAGPGLLFHIKPGCWRAAGCWLLFRGMLLQQQLAHSQCQRSGYQSAGRAARLNWSHSCSVQPERLQAHVVCIILCLSRIINMGTKIIVCTCYTCQPEELWSCIY